MRRAQLADQLGHRGIGLQQFGIDRQQVIVDVADLALVEARSSTPRNLPLEPALVTSVVPLAFFTAIGCGIGIMGVAAEDDVDAGDAACELEIDVHAVVRQQHDGIDLVGAAQAVDMLLQLLLADAEGPVRREALGMRDRHIGEGLADDRDAMAAELLDHATA